MKEHVRKLIQTITFSTSTTKMRFVGYAILGLGMLALLTPEPSNLNAIISLATIVMIGVVLKVEYKL